MPTATFTPGHCAVCGTTPTVKSHIIPRAIAHDIRAGFKHLVSGSMDQVGVTHLQSGHWNGQLLCREHEESFSRFDDYGVRFIRKVRQELEDKGEHDKHLLPNRSPETLRKFFLSLVWKKNLTNQTTGGPNQLGPYHQKIREYLSGENSSDASVIILRSPNSIAGKHVPIIVEPHRISAPPIKGWKCDIGWISAIIILNRQNFPSSWRPFDACFNDPATVFGINPIDIRDRSDLKPLIAQMQSKTR